MDDHGCVGAVGDGFAVGVIHVLAGVWIAGVPSIDDQRRRAGAQVRDVSVKCVELVYKFHAVELE
jgi:hypothetical protein